MDYSKHKEKINNNKFYKIAYPIAMIFVLAVCTYGVIALLDTCGITEYSTEYITSLNLTLVTLIFALNTLPSYIQKRDYENANLDLLINKEKQKNLVDDVIMFFTVLSVLTTSICVARPLNLLLIVKMNCNVINWNDECPYLIVNLVAYMINLGLQSVFSLNRDTPISGFIQQVQCLKKLQLINFSEYKPCWFDDILIAALLGPAILFSALSPSFLGLSLLFTIIISTSLFLHSQSEIKLTGTRRRISCTEKVLQVFILVYFTLFLVALPFSSHVIFQLVYRIYLFLIAFCVFLSLPLRSNGYIRTHLNKFLLKRITNVTKKQVMELKCKLDNELNPHLAQLINARLDISHTDYSLNP